MPMSEDFRLQLQCRLRDINGHFGTPYHLYHEKGIRESGQQLLFAFNDLPAFNNFFAVKALPNPRILRIIRELGMGFDCSSIPELLLARQAGASPEQIMFTSNNTSFQEFEAAMSDGGCIINLDDIGLIAKVPEPFPELICFRYNPGARRGNLDSVIGNPETCKYGVPHEQIVQAFSLAQKRGATRFGLHTMIVSNERDYRCFVETARMLLEVARMISAELNIRFELINIGGGLGIPYRLEDQPVDLTAFSAGVIQAMNEFATDQGYLPALYMECGRFVTGPHGVLVTKCLNRKSGYHEFAGLDTAAISSMMRPPMYYPKGGYHHLTVHHPLGAQKIPNGDGLQTISVVGPACEDNDRFAWNRPLPEIKEGDAVVIHDSGAHAYAMANNYNGRLRPQELLLRSDGLVELIRRAETADDLFATLRFEEQVIHTGFLWAVRGQQAF